ncbi:hypothetical protein E4U51_003448 [Claviceps purpurea]|nr:hypothetical protein E4U51_003448 [Claviceps purpurea]
MRPKEAQMGGHDVFVENTFNVIGILRAQHDPGVNGPGAAPHELIRAIEYVVGLTSKKFLSRDETIWPRTHE